MQPLDCMTYHRTMYSTSYVLFKSAGGRIVVRGCRIGPCVQGNVHLRVHSNETGSQMEAYKQQCYILTFMVIATVDLQTQQFLA